MKKIKITRKQRSWIAYSAMFLLVCGLALYFLLRPKPAPPLNILVSADAPFLASNPKWADSLIQVMTLEEKIGQLLMIDCDRPGKSGEQTIDETLISDIKPGSICLSGGSLKLQLAAIEIYKKKLSIPLINAVSAETGLLFPSDTLSRTSLLPGISAISDDSVISQLSVSVSKQLKAAGIFINFAPDFSMIYKNDDRSWEPSYKFFIREFSSKTLLYMKKQQENGIMVCASYFPNYSEKSKKKLSPEELLAQPYDTIMVYPFRSLCTAGLSGIQVSHTPDKISDSSSYQIKDSLHSVIPFKGIVISDFTRNNYYSSANEAGTAELLALKSGSDMVRIKGDVKKVYDFLLKAANGNQLTTEELNLKVKKILLAKSWSGLNKHQVSINDTIYRDFPWKEAEVYGRKAIESSLVLLANKKRAVPLGDIANMKIASVVISSTKRPKFEGSLDHYAGVAHFSIAPDADETAIKGLASKLAAYNTIIVAVFTDFRLALNSKKINDFIHSLEKGKTLVVAHLGRQESLALLDRFPVMIQSFSDDGVSQSLVAQAIFGGAALPAYLPLACSGEFCYGDGSSIKNPVRLKYSIPEEAGIGSEYIRKIDSIISGAMSAGAFPGCEVFVACKGKVVLNRGYGFHTYDHKEEVHSSDLYDLASVTKVAASTIAMMALYDQGKINLDTTLNYYFKDLDKNSHDKRVRDSKLNYITVRQLMTHTSGLPAGLPIARFLSPKWYLTYMLAVEKRRLEQEGNDTIAAEEEQSPEWMIDTSQLTMAEDTIFQWLFSKAQDKEHKLQIGEDFFMRGAIIDSIWQMAKQTAVRKNRTYLYSDMNFYLVMKVIEAVTHIAIDKFVAEKFYRPLNLKNICYTPMKSVNKSRIVPTEEEKIFRKQLVHGYVHDPTAALLGGISGNAGLFSDAEDLGILLQMLLNGGTYGGRRYLSENTIKLFTSVQEGGYRGLGWDHQTKSGMKMVAQGASPATYGHTGFTGTCLWVDPVNQVVYVFLSNRVNPKSTNQKINGMRIRQKVQQVIYEALQKNNAAQAAPAPGKDSVGKKVV
jgi:beta-N-acetylhexosaminidase